MPATQKEVPHEVPAEVPLGQAAKSLPAPGQGGYWASGRVLPPGQPTGKVWASTAALKILWSPVCGLAAWWA